MIKSKENTNTFNNTYNNNKNESEDNSLKIKILSEQSIKILQDYDPIFNGIHLNLSNPKETMETILNSINNQKRYEFDHFAESLNRANAQIQKETENDLHFSFMSFINNHPFYFSLIIVLVFLVIFFILFKLLSSMKETSEGSKLRQYVSEMFQK